MKTIKIKLNEKEIECPEGQTIMQVAQEHDVYLPSLCEHDDFKHKANCRICIVEIDGRKNLVTSCSTKAEEGMVIRTDTDRVKHARNLNIELLFAEHIERCPTCIWRVNCKLLDLADRYKILISRFKDRKGGRKVLKFDNAVELDGTQCIDCRNCIEVCSDMQKINHLKLEGKGINQEVVENEENICINCGQCAVHCPVGAAQEQASWGLVEKELKNKEKIVVAQVSCATFASVGEEFKEEASENFSKLLVSSLKQLGFKYVFDDAFANMLVSLKAAEYISTAKNSARSITSSCPAWLKYVDNYRPELKNNLLNLKPPMLIGGEVIKTYWAQKMKIDPKNLVVVAISPCTALKHEISKKDLKTEEGMPVDYALTTREMAWLIKKNKIILNNLKPKEIDLIINEKVSCNLSGILGGEMQLILNVLDYLSKNKNNDILEKVNRRELRFGNIERFIENILRVGEKDYKIAVVNSIGNIGELENIENYDLIEVRACPDGCVGGGGQPIPTNRKFRKKRSLILEKLYKNNKTRGEEAVLKWQKENLNKIIWRMKFFKDNEI